MPLLVALLLGVQVDGGLVEKGRALMASGSLELAEEILERAARDAPASAEANYYLGVCRTQLGKTAEAIEALERADSLASGPNPAVLYELGSAYLHAGRHQDAARALERARDAAPRELRIRLQLGWAYYDGVEGERALAEFEAAAALAPEDALAHFYRGLTEAALGDLDEALAAFERSVALRPDLVDARLGLGRALSQSGRVEEARAELDGIVTDFPEGAAAAHNELGLIAMREGEAGLATRHFESVLALAPDHRQATYNLSLLYRRLGRSDEADALRERFEMLSNEPTDERSLSRTRAKEEPPPCP